MFRQGYGPHYISQAMGIAYHIARYVQKRLKEDEKKNELLPIGGTQ
jgi:hypothetical protein